MIGFFPVFLFFQTFYYSEIYSIKLIFQWNSFSYLIGYISCLPLRLKRMRENQLIISSSFVSSTTNQSTTEEIIQTTIRTISLKSNINIIDGTSLVPTISILISYIMINQFYLMMMIIIVDQTSFFT